MVYNKKNMKIFENRKYINLNNDELNNSVLSGKISHLTDIKKNNNQSNNKNNTNKDIIIFGNKNANNRNNSLKKNLFLNHLNTMENIHNNPRYGNMIKKSTNKLSLINGNETIDNYKKNIHNNSLSQSTVIINNNYNFIKIKNNDI